MDQQLIKKYFSGRCSNQEVEQVLVWFQTAEGQEYLEKEMDEDHFRLKENQDSFLDPEVATEQIFSRIQKNKKTPRRKQWMLMRVAAVLLIAGLLSGVFYWSIGGNFNPQPEITYVSYSAEQGQHKIVTLSDGSKIRLNAGASVSSPASFEPERREVTLKGEAFFEVAHDSDRPFIVKAHKGVIRVLGTKFNVKIDSLSESVEVAVLEGKVALQKEGSKEGSGALLTRNHFGSLSLSNDEIAIEQTNVENYMSWINGRLVFDGEPLWEISRQLERIYNIEIVFKSEDLKELHLSANFEKTNLEEVLNIIANTLDIRFRKTNNEIIWTENE